MLFFYLYINNHKSIKTALISSNFSACNPFIENLSGGVIVEEVLLKTIVYVAVGIVYILINSLLKSKKLESEVKTIRKVIKHAVEYVEQVSKIEDLHGNQKKQYAKTVAKNMLKDLHINVSDGIIDTIIESMVFYMNLEKGDENNELE